MAATTPSVSVRAATEDDLSAMAAMAASLVRFHHEVDPQRFFLPDGVEQGYRQWFSREMRNEDAILLVAHDAGAVVGYLYGRIEERDWNMLLDRHAALHDIYVADTSRQRRVGEALVIVFADLCRARGIPRVVLSTAASNTPAQALFARCGFRVTMLEMTREL